MLIKNHKTELDLQFYCGEFAFYYDFITHALPWSDSGVLAGIAHLVAPSRDVPAVVTISRRVVFRGQSGAKLGEGTCFSLRKNFESRLSLSPRGSRLFLFSYLFFVVARGLVGNGIGMLLSLVQFFAVVQKVATCHGLEENNGIHCGDNSCWSLFKFNF